MTNQNTHSKTILETERLIFRAFEPDDVDDLYHIYSQPDMMRYIGNGVTPTYQQTKDWVQRQLTIYGQHKRGLWATVEKESGCLIGRCGLTTWEIEGATELEVGYLIDRNYWGQGLGTEAARAISDWAFCTQDVTQLISLIHSANHASRCVAKKNGMQLWKKITLCDIPEVCVYRIQREMWEKKQSLC